MINQIIIYSIITIFIFIIWIMLKVYLKAYNEKLKEYKNKKFGEIDNKMTAKYEVLLSSSFNDLHRDTHNLDDEMNEYITNNRILVNSVFYILISFIANIILLFLVNSDSLKKEVYNQVYFPLLLVTFLLFFFRFISYIFHMVNDQKKTCTRFRLNIKNFTLDKMIKEIKESFLNFFRTNKK